MKFSGEGLRAIGRAIRDGLTSVRRVLLRRLSAGWGELRRYDRVRQQHHEHGDEDPVVYRGKPHP